MKENYGTVREKIDPANYLKAAKHRFKEKTKSCPMEEEDGFDKCLFSSANYSIMGRKPRQQLTEDEKEARWLRRVLANRESARQTIRRRQAMLVELTQKTADLEMVNENLKRERELAESEYNLLKDTNQHLKALINDEMMKKEAMVMMKEKEKEKLELQNAESFDSVSLTGPSVISNQSSSGPSWQSFPPQASNGCIQILGSENGVATLMPMWMPNVEQMNSAMIAHPGAFVYVLPVPLLYPFTAPISTHLVQTSEPNDSLVREFGSCCSPEKMIHEANGEPSLPMRSKLRAACPSVFAGQEAGSVPSGDEDNSVGFKNYVKKPPFISLHEGEDTTAVTCHTTDFQTEKNEGLRIVPSNRRLTDPVAAAIARKRRKELRKLKNLWT